MSNTDIPQSLDEQVRPAAVSETRRPVGRGANWVPQQLIVVQDRRSWVRDDSTSCFTDCQPRHRAVTTMYQNCCDVPIGLRTLWFFDQAGGVILAQTATIPLSFVKEDVRAWRHWTGDYVVQCRRERETKVKSHLQTP